MFRQLLVAYNGSAPAQAALLEAIEIARTGNARLTVMTVVPQPALWALGFGHECPVDPDDFGDQVVREYQGRLDAAVGRVPHDIPVTKLLRLGPAAPAILEEANSGRHDLLAMGSRSRGDLASLLLGSVSRRILRDSRITVLSMASGHHQSARPRRQSPTIKPWRRIRDTA